MTAAADYWLHGLRIRSEIELPDLPPAPEPGEPDVWVKLGTVDSEVRDNGPMEVIGRRASFAITNTARYAIEDGSTITVEPREGSRARNVRLFLLGSAMGALVHQRGLLPLHASTILIDGKAVVFMGHSKAGKSTLAAWFHDLGNTVLGDDVCVVRLAGDRPTVSAGLPRLRLGKSSLDATGRDPTQYPLSFAGLEGPEKYDVALDGQMPPQGEVELAAIYDLAMGERLDIRPISGLQAADAVIANTYRGGYVALVGDVRRHWEACVRLVQHTPVLRLERPWDLGTGAQIAQRIFEHAVKTVNSGG